jgi:serine protease Do
MAAEPSVTEGVEMIPGRQRWAVIAVATVGFAVGMLVTARLEAPAPTQAISFWGSDDDEEAEPTPAEPPVLQLPDFAALAKRLSPSVVNISTSQEMEELRKPFGTEDPFREFWEPFERFFGPHLGPLPREPFKQRSLGSGFVLSADGYIVTNNHVVENADEIIVRMSDEEEVEAKLIGRDPKTDLALIRLEGREGLPPAPLGDSDDLDVGEWVMAIGNPFGLDQTVTAGIVSAKGRHIGGPYDDFIQTDASINPGNSGGPLLNTRGEVVGINTAIFTRGGGNIGIGFAIPINLARDVLAELRDKGKVVRGWLGVMIQRVTPEIGESLGLDEAQGALVADVLEDGPARKAGIKTGDVIYEFDGKPIKESGDLPLIVARTPVGKKVEVRLIRDREKEKVRVEVGELPESDVAIEEEEGEEGELGMTVQTLTPEVADSLGAPRDLKGVVVTGVEPGSPASDAGLSRGDIILEVNRVAVGDVGAYRDAMRSASKEKSVLFLVRRGDNTIFLALKSAK